ncbi:metallophosphoesterase [Nonomuraea sp. ZG12]|uniref:metallophosphoesterase n=1 Tax=Nonomuraea sp. ZG12 TaxID=3452207 RepID=UPI003F89979E
MPFGIRTLSSGSDHDFDRFYVEVLRPIAQTARWAVLRADELAEQGTIVNQAFRHLHSADLVVADLSAPNGNVYYELGIRHAISPGKTILVAARGTELPFDLAGQRVLFYDLDFAADTGFQTLYARALNSEPDLDANPVRSALTKLGLHSDPNTDHVAFQQELNLKIDRARNVEQLVAVWHWARQFDNLPISSLLSLGYRLAEAGDYATAVHALDAAFPMAAQDYEVHRQRGFYLRKLGRLEEAEAALTRANELNPSDPETLGMLGGALKRQRRYAEALERYEAGARLSPTSLYLAVAQAGMSIIAAPHDPEHGLALYRELLTKIESDPGYEVDSWANLVAAEASFVLGRLDDAYAHARAGVRLGAGRLDLESATEQIRMLDDAGFPLPNARGFVRWLSQGAAGAIPRNAGQAAQFKKRIIFHLSDVHFGSFDKEGRKVDAHRFHDSENTSRLSLELQEEFVAAMQRSGCEPANATIVLSGDSTYTASESEFDLVRDFLNELCGSLGLEPRQVVVVPGNHDIDWFQSASNWSHRFDNYLAFAVKFYGEPLFRELFPLVTWDLKMPGKRPAPNELIYYRADDTTAFVGLNSCVFEDNQNHYGFIGKRQLDNVNRVLDRKKAPEIRIAVMHHHLHPFPEPLETRKGQDVTLDLSTVRDAGMVEQRLEKLGFSLLLHGHKHKPQLRETLVRDPLISSSTTVRPLIVSGCGSTGVSAHGLEHNQPNHFAILELLQPTRSLGADFVSVEWRELTVSPGAEWATKQRWTLKG